MNKKFNTSAGEFKEKCKQLVNNEKIIIHCREFGDVKLEQISLQVKEIDSKVFLAVLRSLKLDEIFPCEKAIQSRIREAFNLKLTQSEWSNLINFMEKVKSETNFTFFSHNLSDLQFLFQRISYKEEITYAIYPKGEEWASSDQFGDASVIKQTPEWGEMIKFLYDFFTKDGKIITMTGGKYGCAALVKNFGSNALKNISLGKLSFMIQLAINQDIIRYQKTLLIWTASYPIILSDKIISDRIKIIKEEVIKLLKPRVSGLPLAQIPVYLKRKLKFQLKISELGFKKLKDLLKTFPEITLKPDNCKKPSAFYNPLPTTITEIQYNINDILEKNKYCINEYKLNAEIIERIGKINWIVYKSKSLIGFIDEFCKNIKLMKVGNEYIFIGRETDKEELSISTHNSEYFIVTDNEEKCNDYVFLDICSFE